MARRPATLVSVVLLCSLATAATVTAVAGAQDPRIKPGISTAGIDLSNLTVAEAKLRLDQQLAPRLQGDLVLGAAGRPWTLKMAEAKLALDSERTAKRALHAKAGVTAVVPKISFSRVAVRQFVNGVAGRVRQAPRDAAVRITVRHIYRKRARAGKALSASASRAAVEAALADPAAPRVLHQRLVRVSPKVHYGDLASVYGTILTIDRSTFRLRLFKRLKFSKRYSIAVGMAGVDTPSGRYAIQNKAIDPAWHVPNSAWAGSLAGSVVPGGAPDNPLKARWLGIANGVGIHGTAEAWSIGTRASHGCIRMHVDDVKDLYQRVPVGTSVLIK